MANRMDMARQTIRLYGRQGKSSLCQHVGVSPGRWLVRSADARESPDQPEFDEIHGNLRVVCAQGALAGAAQVHVLIAGSADEARNLLQKCRPAAGKTVMLSNKMHGVEDPLVAELAQKHGHPCAVADLKTGQGVPECWALIKAFL
jgi:hypothetical protein